jgi:hypothetical protein
VILPCLHQHTYLTGEGKNDLFITTPWQEDIYNVHVRAKSNRGEERLEFKFCREEKIVLVRLHCMPEMTNGAVRTCRYPACAACARTSCTASESRGVSEMCMCSLCALSAWYAASESGTRSLRSLLLWSESENRNMSCSGELVVGRTWTHYRSGR